LLPVGPGQPRSRVVHGRSVGTAQELHRIIARLSPSSPATDRFAVAWRYQGQDQKDQKGSWDSKL